MHGSVSIDFCFARGLNEIFPSLYIEHNSGEEMLTEVLCTFFEEHILNR